VKSWRAGAKLIHEELGFPVSRDRQPGDLLQSSTNDHTAAAAAVDVDDDDKDDEDKCQQYQQQNKAESDVLLQDLVTVTTGKNLLLALWVNKKID